MPEPLSVTRAGTRLACLRRQGAGPAIVFLPGHGSDMAGSKALALDDWAARRGRALIRFDYAGCGESGGRFEDGTLEGWRDDALAVIQALAPTGPLVLVGSSMGGWIALLVALALGGRVTGLVGIAAAPDFTDWGYGEAERATLAAEGRLLQPSLYSDTPTLITRAFWESGQRQRLLSGGGIGIDCPVRLLQGQADPEVPWRLALDLAGALRSADVRTILIKDGDHRLSRPGDIALLLGVVEALPETP